MSLKQTTIVSCDHIHNPGKENERQCLAETSLENIVYTQPYFRIKIEVEVIDGTGAKQLLRRDIHTCRWDGYHVLSAIHDEMEAEIVRRVQLANDADMH